MAGSGALPGLSAGRTSSRSLRMGGAIGTDYAETQLMNTFKVGGLQDCH